MSAPPTELPASLSTSGYEDGLGRRTLIFDREDGAILEHLHLRPELGAFEGALRQRIAKAAAFEDERFARVRSLDRDAAGGLVVVSEFVAGSRVSDLLETLASQSADEATSPGVDTALGFLLEILPALSALHAAAGCHGAVAPRRLVLTPTGQVVLLDSVFGQTLERLQLTRRRLWTELRVAAPPAAGPARFDVAADIGQASLTAVMLVVGRLLKENEYPDGLAALVTEVIEIAQIRGSARFATELHRFFQRTLPLPGRKPYTTADEADTELRQLAREIGIQRCRIALTTFIKDINRVRDLAAAQTTAGSSARSGAQSSDSDEDASAGALTEDEGFAAELSALGYEAASDDLVELDGDSTPDPIVTIDLDSMLDPIATTGREETTEPFAIGPDVEPDPAVFVLQKAAPERAARLDLPIAPVVEPAPIFAAPPAAAPQPVVTIEPVIEAPAVMAFVQHAPEPVAAVQAAGESPAAPVPLAAIAPAAADPIPVTTVEAARPAPYVVAAAPAPEPAVFMAPPAAPPEGAVAPPIAISEILATPEPVRTAPPIEPAPVPVAAAAAPAAQPEPEEAPAAARRKQKRGSKKDRDKLRSNAAPRPAPVVIAPPIIPMPAPIVMAPPVMPHSGPAAALPVMAQPQYPPVTQAAPGVIGVRPAPVPPAPIQVKVKTDLPTGYAPVAVRSERTEPADIVALPYVQRGLPEARSSSFPWKLAAAAVLVVVVGIGAGRAYLPARASEAEVPATVAPPVTTKRARATATGSLALVTQPAGARVLVDGKAAGETPVTLEALTAGRHVITFVTSSGSVRKTVQIEAGKSISLDVPIYSGWIAVFAPITLDISENGRGIGTTEQGRLMLSPGRHVLTLSSREFEYSSVQTVDIEPGEERSLTVQPMGELNLNALPWAEVWIDGQKRGETPIAHLQVPLGTHELLFKNAQFGERRVTTTVTASAPVTASVDFTKSPQP